MDLTMTDNAIPDYGDLLDGPTLEDLGDITNAVDAYLQAKVVAEEAEAEAKAKREIVRRFEEQLLPEALRNAGVEKIETASGYVVKIKSDVRASIPKAREDEAFAWLEKEGHGGLIKRNVVATFAMGEDERAKTLLGELSDQGYTAGSTRKVEPSSLRALMRRLVITDEPKPVPADLFGLYQYDKAEVKAPKK